MSGLQTPYGRNETTDKLVHISDISKENRGLKCGLVCPGCGESLVARFQRTSERFTSHFAHYREGDCDITGETLLHMFAKQVLFDEQTLILSELAVAYGPFKQVIEAERLVQFDSVLLEKGYQNFIPDVTATSGNTTLFIEILVTHAVDNEKREKLVRAGIPLIEIDLSSFSRNVSKPELIKAVCEDTFRQKWIYHPGYENVEKEIREKETYRLQLVLQEIDQLFNEFNVLILALDVLIEKELVAIAEEEKQLNKNREILLWAQLHADSYETYCNHYRQSWVDGTWLKAGEESVKEHPLYDQLFTRKIKYPTSMFMPLNSCSIACHPFLWQAYLYAFLFNHRMGVSIPLCIRVLEDEFGCVIWNLRNIDDPWIAAYYGVYDLKNALRVYFDYLIENKLMSKLGTADDPYEQHYLAHMGQYKN